MRLLQQLTETVMLCLVAIPIATLHGAPVKKDDPKNREIAALIDQLGSRKFTERKMATVKLAKLGESIRDVLKQAHKKHEDPEVRKRVVYLLRRLDGLERKRLQKLEGKATVHAVGVYKSQVGGAVKVDVKIKNKPIILVLTAYDPLKWEINAVEGAQIVKVILGGYRQQQVTGTKALIESYSYYPRVQGRKRLYYAYQTGNSTYTRFNNVVKQITGKNVTKFVGARTYSGQTFVVGP